MTVLSPPDAARWDNTGMLDIPLQPHPQTLEEWLAHCERLHPVTIDMGLDRVQRVARRLGLRFDCPVITVAGTNGKGSTCAMLESIYGEAGYRTGLYTSPHLVHFEERCRIGREAVAAEVLLPALAEVEVARRGQAGDDGAGEVSLTYFEFTTLAILQTLSRAGLDVIILEVGLGGRLDAVNIIDTDCAVITSIDLDHMAILGPDREAIGYEKAGIMRTGRPVVVSDPVPPQSVLDRAMEVGADLWRIGQDFHFAGDKQQWGWATHPSRGGRRYSGMAYPALRGANQLLNASGALAAVEVLRGRLPVTAQAVRNGLVLVELPGRFQIVPGTPVLVLDVAHNPQSVAALSENLDSMGFYPTTRAVFGAMADKDLPAMLARIAPLIDHWHVCDLPLARAATAQALSEQLMALPGTGARNPSVSCHDGPTAALEAAVAAADPADRIVVFGSFFTVGGVLQQGVPRLSAKHLSA
jgi:dihydrofolate synthase/folylpolyglutamate synthase